MGSIQGISPLINVGKRLSSNFMDKPIKPMHTNDVVIVGGGIAGLWIAARLRCEGYNPVVIEKKHLGGVQTLASQGIVHGGQKFAIQGSLTDHAASLSAMPSRWEECFQGNGDIDLTSVRFLSKTQLMWAAGSIVSSGAVLAAASMVNTNTRKIAPDHLSPALLKMWGRKRFKGSVYELPEKVLDIKSLVKSLAEKSDGRIFTGIVERLSLDGRMLVSGVPLQAHAVIFAAGMGNELAFELLDIEGKHTQRRPLRQIMVKPLPCAFYGHGIVNHYRPRVSITSHPVGNGEYVWYLGANIAEESLHMTETEALEFACREMQEMFPQVDWNTKEWASLEVERAEPFDEKNRLPPGPHICRYGKVIIAWPTKLTFAPLLADQVYQQLQAQNILPQNNNLPLSLPSASMGMYPWEAATWQKIS